MNKPEFLFPMLRVLLDTGTFEELGRQIGVSGAFIAQMKSHIDRKNASGKVIANLLKLLNDRFPSSQFTAADFESEPFQFLDRFPKDEIKYREAASAGGIKLEPLGDPRIRRLFGNFARVYMCTNPSKLGANMIAIDQFQFSASTNPNEAFVTQMTNEFSGDSPTGLARLYGPTLFLELKFPSPQYPPAFFLSSFPRGEIISSFVAGSLDVKFGSSAVVARPMIFVRIKDIVPIGLTFEAETQIYEESKKLFDKVVILNSEKYELVPRPELLPEDLIDWRRAFEALEQGAPS